MAEVNLARESLEEGSVIAKTWRGGTTMGFHKVDVKMNIMRKLPNVFWNVFLQTKKKFL